MIKSIAWLTIFAGLWHAKKGSVPKTVMRRLVWLYEEYSCDCRIFAEGYLLDDGHVYPILKKDGRFSSKIDLFI